MAPSVAIRMIDTPGVGCVAASLAHETELKQGQAMGPGFARACLSALGHIREGALAVGWPIRRTLSDTTGTAGHRYTIGVDGRGRFSIRSTRCAWRRCSKQGKHSKRG